MVKRLMLLNGLAIVAVVLNHASGVGYLAMFHWANLYLPVQVPYWEPIGSFEYYILLILNLLPVFSVPAFIFVAGFFTAYAAKGAQGNVGWSTIRSKIMHLLYPYLFWSLFIFIFDFALGTVNSPLQYLEKLFFSGALAHYGFIPLLSYLYLCYLHSSSLLLKGTYALVFINNYGYAVGWSVCPLSPCFLEYR
jgi:fucose 4-O-acetylase-like acetyltransferase